MSNLRNTVLEVVTSAVVELNETLEDKIDLEQGEGAGIYGEHGVVDSLDLVQLILIVEERAHDRLGKALSLSDDRAVSQFRSPFRSVGSLTDYVTQLAA